MQDSLRIGLGIDEKLAEQIVDDVGKSLLPEGFDHIPNNEELTALVQILVHKYKDNPQQLFYVGFTYAVAGREISIHLQKIATAKIFMEIIGAGLQDKERKPDWAGP